MADAETPPWLGEDLEEEEEEQAPQDDDDEDDKEDDFNCVLYACLCCACLILLAAAVLLILTFVVGIFGSDKEELPPPPTFNPSNCMAFAEIPEYSRVTILEQPESAQYQALKWLCNDPNVEGYSTQKRLQRFALAVLYFGLEGDNWQWRDQENANATTTEWLTYIGDECDWNVRDSQTNRVLQGVVCGGEDANTDSETTPTTIAKRSHHYQSNTPNIFQHERDDEAEEKDSSFTRRRLQQQDNTTTNNNNNNSGSITALKLERTNLAGTLPPEIKLLRQLRVLDMGYNRLSGLVRADHFVEELTQLTRVNLTNNALEGKLQIRPWWFLLMHDALEVLDLSSNQLSGSLSFLVDDRPGTINGTIPFVKTSPIRILSFGNNTFTGSLPPQFGNTTFFANLEALELNGNQWTGILPSELGLLPNLKSVLLHDNEMLNGTIPVAWENLARANLQHANIENTSLTGVVPKELCSIEQQLLYDCGPLCGCQDCACGDGNDDGEADGTNTTATTEDLSTNLDDGDSVEEEETDLNDTNTTGAEAADTPTTATTDADAGESNSNGTTATAPDDTAAEDDMVDLIDEDTNNASVDNATVTNATTDATDGPATTVDLDVAGESDNNDTSTTIPYDAEDDTIEVVDEDSNNTPVNNATVTNVSTAVPATSQADATTLEGNATQPEEQQELTEPLDFGLVERYSIRLLNYSWNNNRFLINYRASDYILEDSISYVLYDTQECRDGGTEVENPDQYLLVDIQAPSQPPIDLTNEGKGTRSPYKVEVRLNRTTIGEAPFFVPTEDNRAELNFCFGLRINYNQVDGWNQELEATAAEHSIQMNTDLTDRKSIWGFNIRRSTYVP